MARRGLSHDPVRGLKGYKFHYGYKGFSSMGPSTVITTPLSSPRVNDTLAQTIGATFAPTLYNLDAFAHPQDGKWIAKESYAALLQWSRLDYIQKLLDEQEKKLRPYFITKLLPINVDVLYLTLVFDLNIKYYPEFKGARLSISLPVKGTAKRRLNFSMFGGNF